MLFSTFSFHFIIHFFSAFCVRRHMVWRRLPFFFFFITHSPFSAFPFPQFHRTLSFLCLYLLAPLSFSSFIPPALSFFLLFYISPPLPTYKQTLMILKNESITKERSKNRVFFSEIKESEKFWLWTSNYIWNGFLVLNIIKMFIGTNLCINFLQTKFI